MNFSIQEKLKNKVREELKTFAITYPGIFSNNIIETFFKCLLYDLNRPELKLDGLRTRVINSMSKILLEDLSKDEMLAFFPDFVKIEPFLKKILYLTQPSVYNTLSTQNRGLSAYLNTLGLNTNNVRFDTATMDNVYNLPDFAVHLLRVYKLRNIESHSCEFWSKKEIYENIESVLLIYIFSTFKHAAILQNCLFL